MFWAFPPQQAACLASAIIDHLWSFDDHRKKTQLSLISRFAAEIESSRAPTDLIETVYVWGIGLRLYLTKKMQTQVSEPEPSWAEQQTMLAVAKAREDKTGFGDRLAVLGRLLMP